MHGSERKKSQNFTDFLLLVLQTRWWEERTLEKLQLSSKRGVLPETGIDDAEPDLSSFSDISEFKRYASFVYTGSFCLLLCSGWNSSHCHTVIWYLCEQCLEVDLRQSNTLLRPSPSVGHNLLYHCADTGTTSSTPLWVKSWWVDSKTEPLTLIHVWLGFCYCFPKGSGHKDSSSPSNRQDLILLKVIYLHLI